MDQEVEMHWPLAKDQALDLYRTMLLIRYCEEQLVKSYARGEIPGGMHTYIGEEAVASGVCANLRHEDAVFSTHRGHGHALAKGMPPEKLIAEVLGKAAGSSAGRRAVPRAGARCLRRPRTPARLYPPRRCRARRAA